MHVKVNHYWLTTLLCGYRQMFTETTSSYLPYLIAVRYSTYIYTSTLFNYTATAEYDILYYTPDSYYH